MRFVDHLDQLSGCQLAEFLRVLLIGRQIHDLGHIDAVIADSGNIIGNAQSSAADLLETADIGIIIREDDQCGRIVKIQQLYGLLLAVHDVMVMTFQEILIRNIQTQLSAGGKESTDTLTRHPGIVTADESDLSVTHLIGISDDGFQTLGVVRKHRRTPVHDIVDDDHRI